MIVGMDLEIDEPVTACDLGRTIIKDWGMKKARSGRKREEKLPREEDKEETSWISS